VGSSRPIGLHGVIGIAFYFFGVSGLWYILNQNASAENYEN
jgi:hypothetical protein